MRTKLLRENKVMGMLYNCYKCSGGGGLPSPYALKAEDIDLLIPIDDPNCDPWRYESYTYTVRIALKNDGALSPPLCRVEKRK